MHRAIRLFLLSGITVLFLSFQAQAYVQGNDFLCVDGSGSTGLGADLQAALDEIATDNRPDSNLRLVGGVGVFSISPNNSGHFNIVANHSLSISGGWDANCSAQTPNPQLTVLQGGTDQKDAGGVLSVVIVDNPSAAVVSISNLTIQSGSSELDGGGLNVEHDFTGTAALATLNISKVVVQSSSSATFGSGIAIFDWDTSGGMQVNISDCLVQDNFVPADSFGGPAGIYIDNLGSDIETTISRCQILDNEAFLNGGGLFIDPGSSTITLTNNVIAGNISAEDSGGGIYIRKIEPGDITLTNNTITENVSTGMTIAPYFPVGGGGLYIEVDNDTSRIQIYNNIIFNNSADEDGADIYLTHIDPDIVLPNEVDIRHNDFDTTRVTGFFIEGSSNLSMADNLDNEDPLFSNAAAGDYHLTGLSPAIDAGDNFAPARPADDLDSNPRPVNVIVDMGAYEFQGNAPTTTTTVPTTTTTTSTTSTTQPGSSTTTTSTTTTTLVSDQCPDDPEKNEPGICGCGISDVDTDLDSTPDCNDGCPDDPDKVEPGNNGCGTPEDFVFPGTGVSVSPINGISLTFAEIVTGGLASATSLPKPAAPPGYRFIGEVFDIGFSGVFTGMATVCLEYDGSAISGDEADILLMHRENGAADWQDITTVVDTENDKVCGEVATFSEFAVVMPQPAGGGGGGGCFIATAAYGNYMADDVMFLRRFRDKNLLTNAAGRAFVRFYYTYSPPIADYIAGHESLRLLTRFGLAPLVFTVKNPVSAGYLIMLLSVFLMAGRVREKEKKLNQ